MSIKPAEPQIGLGRVYLPDPRDARFPLRAALTGESRKPKTSHWFMGKYRDQGYTSHCVRYGISHLLLSAPVVRLDAFDLTRDLYQWAQRNDPWPGEEPSYYGTSVGAGLEYARQVLGVVSEYRWALSMDDVLRWLSYCGPLVVGTDWWSGMDDSPVWTPTGYLRGGHCYVLSGLTVSARRIRTGNSHDGNFRGWLSFDAVEYLLFGANGECAALTEMPK